MTYCQGCQQPFTSVDTSNGLCHECWIDDQLEHQHAEENQCEERRLEEEREMEDHFRRHPHG